MKMQTTILFLIFLLVPIAAIFLSRCTYIENTTINYNYYGQIKTDLNPNELELQRLINEHRINLGLNPLIAEVLSSQVCLDAINEDIDNNEPPSHNGWERRLELSQVNRDNGSEICASGYNSAYGLFMAYLESEEHRAAIENPDRTHIGISFVYSRNYCQIIKYGN